MKLFTRYTLLVFLLSLSAFSAKGLTAGCTASPSSGCSPLAVSFTNTTAPASGTTYDWDFGNGTPVVHLLNPGTTYNTPGTYTVTLTAHNGGVTSVFTMTITVYPPPTVSFTADDTSVCPGTAITFTSTTVAGVPGSLTYTWNFGDGSSGPGPGVTTHTYSTPGFYTVTLFATNSDGCQGSLTRTSYVHIFTPATPNFSVNSGYFCKTPGHAIFTDLTTGTGPFTYHWTFGDGSPPSTLSNPTHDYTTPGTYTVTLVVTDANGCTDSIVRTGLITVGHLVAGFTLPTSVCVNSSVTFTNTSTPHLTSSWTFGDGGTSAGESPTYSYSAPGTYIVTLVVYDGACYDTISHPITILPGPVASFTISPLHPCPPPVTLTFTPTVPAGTTTSWVYGDGTWGTSTSHTYGNRGVDTIMLVSTDPTSGCRDTVKVRDTLYDLVLTLTASPDGGCKPLNVTFGTNVITYEPDTLLPHPYPFPVTSYSWNFGDGSPTGSGATPSHTYTAVGVYNVIATITTSNGCTAIDSIKVYVGKPPVVSFTAAPTHVCYRDNQIIFTASIISGPVSTYTWQFGDFTGETDSTGIVLHHYVIPGVFSVTLTAFYNGCPSLPVVMTNYITIDSPEAVITSTVHCTPVNQVDFIDASYGDDSHLWIFGDATTSTAKNPTHTYPSSIPYTVELTTYNAASGCRDTAYKLIDLTRPIPHFSTPDTVFCRDSLAVFTATVTGGAASSYLWHSPSGIGADSTLPIFIDTFHYTGIFPIRLVIIDQNGCFDTLIKNNYIHVAKPVAHFIASPTSGCWPLAVTFTDNSSDIPGTTFTSFAWSFGDGATTTVGSPVTAHTFTSAATFATQDIVTDNVGCKDTITESLVTVYRPHAAFSASTVFPCTGSNVTFTNGSVGITGSWWSFGDGDTSIVTSPTHFYSTPGVYNVTLVVTDAHGCKDTATYESYIHVTKPHAGFTMDDSLSICPPLMVHFTNTSTGAINYGWSLGDGSISTAINPSDMYVTTGLYNIMLVATNIYGCKDTAIGHAQIFGYAGAFSYGPLSGCSPLLVRFNATLGNVPTIIWDFADGNTSTVTALDTISHIYLVPGAYVPKLILSDNTGCQSSSIGADTIKVDGVTPGFKTSVPACLGVPFNFVDTSSSYWSTITSWNWLFNGTTSGISNPSFVLNTVGTYPATLQVIDGWGCVGTVTEDVSIHPLPVIIASPDTTICVSDAATLYGYGGVSYTWAPPGTLSCTACNPTNASPVAITNYTVTGTDQYGCTGTDTTSVFLKTKTVSVAYEDTEICQGAVVELRDSGANKFTWIPGGGLSDIHIANPLASPSQTTKYMIIAQLASCIPDTNYVTIIVHPLPTVDAGPDQTVIEGSEAQLLAKGTLISTFLWTPANTLNCDTCPNPVATMSVATTYQVTVSTTFGCQASDSVRVHIICDKSQIFVPNSFTPNGDGENDIFYPRGRGVRVIKSFRIYNRWGQLLFERANIDINDASNAWDGSFNGGTPRPDVYVWILDAICETGAPINLKGDVTIIR